MKSTRLTGLAAMLTLAAGAFPTLARRLTDRADSQPTGRGTRQPRQQLARLCRPVLVHDSYSLGTHHARGFKQLQRKERRTGATTARQQRKLRQTIRTANKAALAKAFPAEQA